MELESLVRLSLGEFGFFHLLIAGSLMMEEKKGRETEPAWYPQIEGPSFHPNWGLLRCMHELHCVTLDRVVPGVRVAFFIAVVALGAMLHYPYVNAQWGVRSALPIAARKFTHQELDHGCY